MVGRLIVTAALAGIVLMLFSGRLIGLYVDYLWFDALGYATVFLTGFWSRIALFFGGALFLMAIFLPNALAAREVARRFLRRVPERIIASPVGVPGQSGPIGTAFGGGGRPGSMDVSGPFSDLAASIGGPEAGRWLIERLGRQVAWLAGLALAVFMGLIAAAQWEAVLRALHAVPFGVADPLFGNDVAFYVFTLPVLGFLQSWTFWALAFTTGAVLALYALAIYTADPSFEHATVYLGRRARAMRTHVLLLVAALTLVIGAGIWLGRFDLLTARHDRIVGADFTDIHARLPATNALVVTAVLMAALAVVTAFRRSYAPLLAGIGLFLAVLLLGRGALPVLVQRLQVDPAELAREQPYLAANINFTRAAFGLQDIAEQTFPAEDAVRPEDVLANPQTISNVRLWDHRPLNATYNQIQTIRPYYAFDDIDIDRYVIDGVYRQVMLSARELAVDRLGVQAQTWVNRRLQYTHGYGVAMSPVNEVTAEGLPTFIVKDLPPAGRLKIDRPEIYYGQQTGNYAVVNTVAQEFDYPRGDENVFSTYEGGGGVRIGPLWRRLALAWQLGDFNLLVSSYVKSDSQVLLRRSLKDRIQRLAPFFKLDRDPYLVVAGGKLYWIQDAYTTSDRYPYSQRIVERLPLAAPDGAASPPEPGAVARPAPFRRVVYNYIRNSAKIAVDAYDGTVSAYLADPDEPIARTYASIFPDLFRPISEMPPELREHVRYPEDLFRVQAQVLRTYHVQDPRVFYNSEDAWGTAMETVGDRQVPVDPYYVIMRLPEHAQEEFLLMLPFTPATRDNMVAWLAARSDGPNYGQLVLFKYPRDRLIYGPAQVDARVDQEPSISSQLTLWNQQGSRVIRGNLLVFPIGSSTLYVEPIYLQAENSRLPELKRVVVATGNRVVMEPTLGEALAKLFGPGVAAAVGGTDPSRTAPVAAGASGVGAAPSAPGAVGPAGLPALESVQAASQGAREAYDQALEALRAGDFARFGEELKRLDQHLRDLERTTGR
ncbi:MAG: UPF0182 family protein [Chloroflexi bacterium]|nr:UPF0182 family protein [Chloroflexota bacterium]